MESTEYASGGFGFIVLDKVHAWQEFLKVVEVVALFEIAAVISIDCGFDEENIRNTLWCYLKLH